MKNIYILIALIINLAFVACNNDDNEDTGLQVIKSSLAFTATAGEGSILVNTDQALIVKSTQLWCQTSVEGNMIKVNVSENGEFASRSALVIIKSDGVTQKVNITQPGVIVNVDNITELRFFASDTTYSIAFKSNADLQITSDQTWCTFKQVDDSLRLSFPENTTFDPKKAILSFTTGNVKKQIALFQNPIAIQPSPAVVTLTSGKQTKGLSFSRNICKGWTATSNQAWCSLRIVRDSLYISVPLYAPATVARTASITVVSGGASKQIMVTQNSPQDINLLFVETELLWYFNARSPHVSGLFASIFGAMKPNLAEENLTLVTMDLQKSDNLSLGTHMLFCIIQQDINLFGAAFYFNFTAVNGTKDQIKLKFTDKFAYNGKVFYDNFPGFKRLTDAMSATDYVLEADIVYDPSWIKFKSKTNEGNTFTLFKEKVNKPLP